MNNPEKQPNPDELVQYRPNLADDLREQRSFGSFGKEMAKILLEEEKRRGIYKLAKEYKNNPELYSARKLLDEAIESYSPEVFLKQYDDEALLLIGGHPNSPGTVSIEKVSNLKARAIKIRDYLLKFKSSEDANRILDEVSSADLYEHEGGWTILSDVPEEFENVKKEYMDWCRGE